MTPLDNPHIKHLIFWLGTLDAWPFEKFGMKNSVPLYRKNKFLFSYFSFGIILIIAYIYRYFNEIPFVLMGHNYVTLGLGIITAQRFTVPWSKQYAKTIVMFINEIHLSHHKDASDYAFKVYNQVEKITKYYKYAMYIKIYTGFVLFNLVPAINNYRKGMFSGDLPEDGYLESCIYYYIPILDFDGSRTLRGWIFTFIYNWFPSLDTCSAVAQYDLLLAVLVFNLWGHIKILRHNILKIPKPSQTVNLNEDAPRYTKEEELMVESLLKECIVYEKMIRGFMGQTSSAFGMMLFFNLMLYQIILCVLLLECSFMTLDALLKYGIILITLLQQLIEFSTVFELLKFESEKIKHAIYELSWESMSVRNRKIVLIFLINTQEPLSLKALGIVPLGFVTMTAILKTSISYFTLLKTFA